ncbi:MAG: beta-glucuronidase [Clostridia bacterium]|nr:beta-glucuronidase [Clostridia bacterium]
MIRLFETHNIREQKELDGMWKFIMQGVDKEYTMPVPGCFEQHPDFLKHRGIATYSKTVYVKYDTNIRLEFKGVSHTADVFFDGEKVAHHYNAFTPFSAVIKDVEKGTHQIDVVVDNTFSEKSALHIPNDYYTYGGITRPVSMEYVGDVYIKNMHFTPSWNNGKWRAKVLVEIENLKQVEITANISIDIADTVSNKEFSALPNSVSNVEFDMEFPKVLAWDNKNPNLYMLNATLNVNNTAVDDLIDRVGFREVKVDGTKLLLNGKPVYLKGFNRHEDYATVGCAVPLQLMAGDLDLMQDMGANAMRTCHYPNDERMLDLCDERGILVWEENHARGFDLAKMQNPNFERQCDDCIREMIENHYNHPSIIIWGILNECASETDDGRRMYKAQYDRIRSMDLSRPCTSATCRHFSDICLDLEDIVSYNIYTNWYENDDIKERNNKEIDWIKSANGGNKPIIISEFGAAAIYGYRSRAREKWSEEFQADLIKESLSVYMNDTRISGVFIWQFADCRVTEEEWFHTRARCHNNKGIVDEYRRPKLAYDTVKEMFKKYGN